METPKSVASQDGAVNTDGNVDSVQKEESLAEEAGKELILGIVGAIGGAIGLAFLGNIYKKLGLKPGVPNPDAHTPADSGQNQERLGKLLSVQHVHPRKMCHQYQRI